MTRGAPHRAKPAPLEPSVDEVYRRRIAELLDSFGEAFAAFDFDWRILHVNRAAAAHFGVDRDAVLGKVIWEIGPQRKGAAYEAMTAVMERREPLDLEAPSEIRPDRWMAMRVFPLEVGIGMSFRDVTERRVRVEREREQTTLLRESEARFRAMADSAPAPVWVTSAAGPIEFVNRAFCDFAGLGFESLLGDAWISIVHPEDVQRVGAIRAAARSGPDPYVFEARFRGADGAWRVMQASSQPRFDAEGVFQGYVGLAVDVTEQRRAEERQRLLINELNHRVKNTLATVQSLAHQTLREGVPREARDRFTDRLFALSAAHNVLTRQTWEGAELSEIAREAVRPYDDPRAPRVAVEGPTVRLAPNVALAISMALHELATNAVKYGALSVADGRVSLAWTHAGGFIHLEWREMDGPPVREPEGRGFGSRLLAGLAAELGAPAEVRFERSGLVCRLTAPAA